MQHVMYEYTHYTFKLLHKQVINYWFSKISRFKNNLKTSFFFNPKIWEYIKNPYLIEVDCLGQCAKISFFYIIHPIIGHFYKKVTKISEEI